MAKHHDKVHAAELLPVIETFLGTCHSPAVVEEGEVPIALLPGAYELQLRNGRLFVEASAGSRLLSRQLTGLQQQRPGILDCFFQRFGGAEGKLTFLDLARPQTAHRQLNASRKSFAQQFRTMLRRQFPQWEITTLSSSMDLRRSFSPVFPRALLTRGSHAVAAMACPNGLNENELLTFALLWFDHVRTGRTSLCLFLPQGSGCLTAHRLRWLRTDELRPRLFLFNEHGSAGEVDGQDLGNLDTRVGSRLPDIQYPEPVGQVLAEVSNVPM